MTKYFWKNGYAIMIGPITTITVAIVAEYCGIVPPMAARALAGTLELFSRNSMLFWMLISSSCRGFLLSVTIYSRAFCQSFQ